MEHALISRRISWACHATVEVAPDWPVGVPPPYLTYFIPPYYFYRYLYATCDTDIVPIRQHPIEFVAFMDEYDSEYRSKYKYLMWDDLLNREHIIWDNFQFSKTVPDSPSYDDTTQLILCFYHDKYINYVENFCLMYYEGLI